MKPIIINSEGNQVEAEYLDAINSSTTFAYSDEVSSDAERLHLELPLTAIGGMHVFKELDTNVNTNFSIGTIGSIGFSTTPIWNDLIGMEVTILTTNNSGWFNVKGVAPQDAPSGYKTIRPTDPEQVYRLKRATFRYTSNGWTLISTTKLDDKYHQGNQSNYYLSYVISGEDFVLDGNIPKGFFFHAVKGYYYRIKISGSVNKDSANNDQAINLTTLYTQVYKDSGFNFVVPSTKIRQREHTVISGSRLLFEDEFLFYDTSDSTITFNVTHLDNDNLTDIVVPTGEFLDFNLYVNVQLLPKDEWHQSFEIPMVGPQTGNVFTIDLPAVNTPPDYLPFDGYYNVDVYVEVAEYDASMLPVNVGTPQMLNVGRSGGGIARALDTSPNYIPPVGGSGRMLNNSLQGSAVIELKEGEKVRIGVTLPNGVNKVVNGGYVDLNFINETTKLLKN